MMISTQALGRYLGSADTDNGEVEGNNQIEGTGNGNSQPTPVAGSGVQVGDYFIPWWVVVASALIVWWLFFKGDGSD